MADSTNTQVALLRVSGQSFIDRGVRNPLVEQSFDCRMDLSHSKRSLSPLKDCDDRPDHSTLSKTNRPSQWTHLPIGGYL
jgi:hypothetical protein